MVYPLMPILAEPRKNPAPSSKMGFKFFLTHVPHAWLRVKKERS
jgi:hypothetical protein